jgi:hypothetical protein
LGLLLETHLSLELTPRQFAQELLDLMIEYPVAHLELLFLYQLEHKKYYKSSGNKEYKIGFFS